MSTFVCAYPGLKLQSASTGDQGADLRSTIRDVHDAARLFARRAAKREFGHSGVVLSCCADGHEPDNHRTWFQAWIGRKVNRTGGVRGGQVRFAVWERN
jgi:hypothetical protein